MNDLVEDCIVFQENQMPDDSNIYDKNVEVAELRRRVGMVFQPNPFSKSICECRLRPTHSRHIQKRIR